MLVIVKLSNERLACFDFGDPLDPKRDAEAHLRWVLADYEQRRDEQWRVPPPDGSAILQRLLAEAGDRPDDLLPIIRALGWYGIPEPSPAVWQRLKHPSDQVKLAAIKSLGQMGFFDSIGYISPFLEHRDLMFRRTALISLGKFGKREVIPNLEATAASDPSLQPLLDQAKQRIEAVASKNLPALVEAVIGTDEYEDLVVLLIVVWELVAAVMLDRPRTDLVRGRAARLLGLGRVRRAIRFLLIILTDETETVALRFQAAVALGRLEAWKAVDALVVLLGSAEPPLQEAAITSLGQIGQGLALEPLLGRWDERAAAGGIREKIRLAVRRLCSESGAQFLTDMLRQNIALSSPGIYFIDDKLNLHRKYRGDLIDAQLNSSRGEVRRDAALLLAFFGQRADAEKLAKMGQQDEELTNREIGQLGSNRLRMLPR